VGPLPGRRLRLLLFPFFLRFLGRHLRIRSPRVARGLRGEGWEDLGGLGFLREDDGGARLYLGIFAALGKLQIGSTVFTWQLPRC
jgi:hypothetical protein